MPTRAPTACAAPGCPHDIPCPAHPRQRWAAGQHGRQMPAGWRTTRARILNRDAHRCRIAGPRCIGTATEVDHEIPGGGEHDANLRAACAPCHRDKTQAEAAAARAAAR